MEDQEFKFLSDGSDGKVAPSPESTMPPPPKEEEKDDGPKHRKTNIEDILVKMQDQTSSVADISRMITIEMTIALKELVLLGNSDPTFISQRRSLNDEIKMLRELQKSLTESDILSKKDTLNFDGPKFQFVFVELLNLYSKALKESGLDRTTIDSVMKQFSDLVKTNDDRLRRETARIGVVDTSA
jgi:hypothetical protein